MSLYKPLHIIKIVQETHDVKTFVFDADSSTMRYKAGQYLTFVFHKQQEEIRRSYSLASSPAIDEPLAITVKRIQNGAVSRPLFDHASVGDKLLTIGPAGFFVLPDHIPPGQQLFFMAAGSGIVPVYSILKTILHSDNILPVVLIYSNRSENETIFIEELKALQLLHANFRIEFLFSLSSDLARARLNQLLLQSLLQQYSVAQPGDMHFYICGPFSYMRMIEIELFTMGFPAARIRKEQFNTVRTPVKIAPPDTDPHKVHLVIDGKMHDLTVQYPLSILEAAKKHGISLPYSCEIGKCGSCAARCVQGNVWMMYNEVLMEDEIRNGLVLTCTGYPVGGDAVLSFK